VQTREEINRGTPQQTHRGVQPGHAQGHVFLGRHVQVLWGEAALVFGSGVVEFRGPHVLLVHPVQQGGEARVGRRRWKGGFGRQELLGEGHAEPAYDDGSEVASRHIGHAAFEVDLTQTEIRVSR